MGIIGFIARRFVRMFVSLIAVSILAFTLLQMAPGNFADIQRATSGATGMAGGDVQAVAGEFASRYGDDLPAWQQHLIFLRGAVTWSMGASTRYPATNDAYERVERRP